MNCVNIFTLGGLKEVNENILIIEINDDIFVFDVDAKYLFNDGVDYIIADFNYLKKNKDKIKAYIITHCKAEKSAIIYYFLSVCPAPVYCTKITKIFTDFFLKKNNFIIEINYFIIEPNNSIQISDYYFLFFSICSNDPDSFGVMIKTDIGNIIYISNFIIGNNDFKNFNNFNINLIDNFSIKNKNNLVLICDSFLARKDGYTIPKCFLTTFIENKIKAFSKDKKIIISVFFKNVFAIAEIIQMAIKYDRKIYLYDDETIDLLKCLSNIEGFVPKDIFVNYTDNNNVLILITGSEKNIFNKIYNFSNTNISNNNDMFIIASPPNDSLELSVVSIKDNLIKNGFDVVSLTSKEYLEMHPSCEDIKSVISIFKPKYYLPVKGYYRDMIANAKIAHNMNLTGKNIFILENGNVLRLEDDSAKILSNDQNIKTGSFLIEGNLINNEINFNKRIKIAENGVLIVNVVIDFKKNQMIAGPKICMFGFDATMIKIDFLLKVLSNRILFTLQKKVSLDIIKKHIIDFLNIFFVKEIKINQIPIIIPIVKNLI